jgi:hypothetical protein
MFEALSWGAPKEALTPQQCVQLRIVVRLAVSPLCTTACSPCTALASTALLRAFFVCLCVVTCAFLCTVPVLAPSGVAVAQQ